MPTDPNSATIECFDSHGDLAALVLVEALVKDDEPAETGDMPPPLVITEPEEAARDGVAAVQLREGCRYLYRIQTPDGEPAKGWHLEKSPLVSKYKNANWLETRSSAGHLTLRVLDSEGMRVATGSAEIQSVKLNYREEYRGMICGLAREMRDYLYELGAATEVPLVSEWSDEPPALQQQVEFLRETLAGDGFWNALEQVQRQPHERLENETTSRSIHQTARFTRHFHAQLNSGGARVNLPDEMALYATMRATGIESPSLPATITASSRRRTVDTAESRFVKHALRDFSAFLDHAEETLMESGNGYEAVLRDIRYLRGLVAQRLAAGFFRSLGEPRMLPLGSPVLQRKAGYREVLQTWLHFKLSSRVKWEGAPEVLGGQGTEFHAGKRDMPALYEAWLFFQLLNLFCKKFDVGVPDKQKLVNEKDLSITLKQGRHACFAGKLHKGIRRLNGEFHYNRSFRHSDDHAKAGSWTRILRPDYTMTFWPGDLTVAEAEQQELAVHIHFDAKYKVHSVDRLFGREGFGENGDDPADLEAEKREQRDGNYKRADLLKMHAYRDAIRRSEGAYVLYPGVITNEKTDNRRWEGFHELLPGLGAFAVRPLANGDAAGMEFLDTFLDGVLDQLSNRASYLEHRRHGLSRVAKTQATWVNEMACLKPELGIAMEDLFADDAEHPLSAHDVTVLVGWCKGPDHLAWIEREGLYNFRAGADVRGSLPNIEPKFADARLIALLDEHGPKPGLLKVRGSGVEIWTKKHLADTGYPSAAHDLYAVFRVGQAAPFSMWIWDMDKLCRLRPQLADPTKQGEPVAMTLAELMTTATPAHKGGAYEKPKRSRSG